MRGKPAKPASAKTPKSFSPPGSARQAAFHLLLVAARKQWLWDALSEAVARVDPDVIRTEVGEFVPKDVQKTLAVAHLREEGIFPLPCLLSVKPSLVGYYRLLLGAPQKSFYKGSTGMGRIKSMEQYGTITPGQKELLPGFCMAMAVPIAELVRQLPHITERDVRELPILTYGAQLQGSNNTRIGKNAMEGVFAALSEVVREHVIEEGPGKLIVKNASNRVVVISLSHDPDVSVEEIADGERLKKLAMEVKGGTDVSNAHNRAGEAEKSHQNAQNEGYKDFWTIISKAGVSVLKLKQDSPTTSEWFDITDILARQGDDWSKFKQRFVVQVGIPIS
jgi:hypothetical protein